MVDIAVPKKRGRPPKVGNSSVATVASSHSKGKEQTKKRGRPSKSKGRGRPPKAAAAVSEKNTDTVQNDADGKQTDKAKGRGRKRKEPDSIEHNGDQPAIKQKKLENSDEKAKTLGRPRKQQTSENDKDTEQPIRRSLGRPSTGAIKLHVATKKGVKVGRPKKNTFPAVVAAAAGSNGVESPKKRGRPPSGKTPKKDTPSGKTPKADTPSGKTPKAYTPSGKTPKAYTPSGKPRGRPKLVSNTNEISFVVKDDNKDDDGVIFSLDPDDCEELTTQIPTPKKRGRPSMSDKAKNASMNIN